MTRKEYEQKKAEIRQAIDKLNAEQHKLAEEYAADLVKRNEIEVGAIVEDRWGVKYAFSKFICGWGVEAWGYKIKKDGTPSARLERISGFKFKEE